MSKAKKFRSRLLQVFVILVFILLAAVLALWLRREIEKKGIAEEPKERMISLDEEAAARAYVWLNQIEDMPLSYAQIREMMGEIEFRVLLTPTGEEGRYQQAPAEGAYAECRRLAGAGLEAAYRETVRSRFAAAGYEERITDEMLDDMMLEAYGVSVAEYLELCGVELLPTEEELYREYSGEVLYE